MLKSRDIIMDFTWPDHHKGDIIGPKKPRDLPYAISPTENSLKKKKKKNANHVISHKHRDSSRKAREWRKSCTCQLSPRDLWFLYILHVEDELVYKGQSSERWCTARTRPKDDIQPDQDMVCRLTQTLKWCTDWYTAWPRCSLQTDPEPEMVHRLV